MFGHQDNDQNAGDTSEDAMIANALNGGGDPEPTVGPGNDSASSDSSTPVQPSPVTPSEPVADGTGNMVDPILNSPAASAPIVQTDAPSPAPEKPSSEIISPAGGYPKQPVFPQVNNSAEPEPQAEQEPEETKAEEPEAPEAPVADNDSNDVNDLLDLKHKALTELAPFVDELDLSPEDKFQTVMMVIQANDDRSLLEKAFTLAHSIDDEKNKAEALLQVVNEINYFTQQQQQA